MRYLVLVAFSWPPATLTVGQFITTTPEQAAPFLAKGWLVADPLPA